MSLRSWHFTSYLLACWTCTSQCDFSENQPMTLKSFVFWWILPYRLIWAYIVCTLRGSQVEISKNHVSGIFVPEGCFNLSKQWRPWWNAALGCISTGSSLFSKAHVKVFPVYKGSNNASAWPLFSWTTVQTVSWIQIRWTPSYNAELLDRSKIVNMYNYWLFSLDPFLTMDK